jgi:hypothetical protein
MRRAGEYQSIDLNEDLVDGMLDGTVSRFVIYIRRYVHLTCPKLKCMAQFFRWFFEIRIAVAHHGMDHDSAEFVIYSLDFRWFELAAMRLFNPSVCMYLITGKMSTFIAFRGRSETQTGDHTYGTHWKTVQWHLSTGYVETCTKRLSIGCSPDAKVRPSLSFIGFTHSWFVIEILVDHSRNFSATS